ncbi:GTP pyrophosphokinase [Leptospira interrogans]
MEQQRGGKYDRLGSVTDLSGVRIVAYYQRDVDKICRVIEDNFLVDWDNSVNKSISSDADRFGYASLHYIVSHAPNRNDLPENIAFTGLKAEVQVRTVLQHAWAVLDRKIRYNNEEDVPREVRRKLFRVSALLEAADENFSEVERIVGGLREEYSSQIKAGDLGQEVNLDSLEVFMRESAAVGELVVKSERYCKVTKIDQENFSDPEILGSISKLVAASYIAGVKTIKGLDEAVVAFNSKAEKILSNLASEVRRDAFTTAGLIRLALVYVVQKEYSVGVLKSVPFVGGLQNAIFNDLHPEASVAERVAIDDDVVQVIKLIRRWTVAEGVSSHALFVPRKRSTKVITRRATRRKNAPPSKK